MLDRSTMRALAIMSQLGLSIALPMLAGVLLGTWLDGQLRTGPLFTLLGIAVGLVLAVLILARLFKFQRSKEDIAAEAAKRATRAQEKAAIAASHAAADAALQRALLDEPGEAEQLDHDRPN